MPAVVLLHSGAWWWGDKDRPMQGLIPLVLRGYLVVSVEYRLSGEAVFPAQIEDCKCAIRFLRAHAGQLQLAPDRLGVWGMAAGGQLAALLGLTAEVKELEGTGGWGDVSSRVQAVADFYGPTDLTDLGAWQGKEYARSISRLLGEESLLDRPELARRASPMSYVRGDAPPFLIVHGDHDRAIPVAQSQALAAALQKAGANVTLKIIPGAGNMFNSTEITEMAYRFFDQHLK